MDFKVLNCRYLSCYDQQMLSLALLRSNRSWYLIWLILSMFFFPVVPESLDDLIQDLAFKALHHRPHTGALYKPSLPANLSGMEVSVVRLRSKTLWRRGANSSYIHIPLKTLPMPHVRRIFIVYQDFGNWSSHYFQVPGYSLVSSVVGFTAYDASNVSSKSVTKLNLNAMGEPIEIRFPNPTFLKDGVRGKRCASSSTNGTVYLSDMRTPGLCYSRNQGYFSIVAPLKRRKQRVWNLWLRGFVIGFAVLVFVCFVAMVLVKFVMAKKMHEMERQADEGVGLETIWILRSKMPSAAVTRTHPVLENASLS